MRWHALLSPAAILLAPSLSQAQMVWEDCTPFVDRVEPAMAYDVKRNRTVVFGGRDPVADWPWTAS